MKAVVWLYRPDRSPLAHGVVYFIALTAADGDWVKELERAQADTGDGHEIGAEHEENGFCVVEGHAQVMTYWDDQRIGAAAQTPVTWTFQGK